MKTSPIKIDLIDFAGSDLAVVNAARVSFAKESAWQKGGINTDYGSEYWDNELKSLSEKDQKLINYLAKHNHWSPFAHTFLSFRCKAPIFLARQLAKHQVGGNWNEVSRRYVNDEPEFWFPDEWRGKPVNAKQGSDGIIEHDADITQGIMDTVEQTLCDYLGMLDLGVAPEQARMILPQNTMTEWIWSGSLMFFARVVKQRSDSHAQKEAQDFAALLANAIPDEFEYSWKALNA